MFVVKYFPCPGGGQNMIFVATVKESVSTGPATQQHTVISQTGTGEPGGLLARISRLMDRT